MPGSLPSLFASFDVETDGNNPMQHSMRSIGIVLFDALHRIVGTFHYNLLPQDNATVDPKCFANFWAIRPRLWEAVRQNAKSPEWVMTRLSRWLVSHRWRGVWIDYQLCDLASWCSCARRYRWARRRVGRARSFAAPRWYSAFEPGIYRASRLTV